MQDHKIRKELLKKVVDDDQSTEDGNNPAGTDDYSSDTEDINSSDDVQDESFLSNFEELRAFVSEAITKEEVNI